MESELFKELVSNLETMSILNIKLLLFFKSALDFLHAGASGTYHHRSVTAL